MDLAHGADRRTPLVREDLEVDVRLACRHGVLTVRGLRARPVGGFYRAGAGDSSGGLDWSLSERRGRPVSEPRDDVGSADADAANTAAADVRTTDGREIDDAIVALRAEIEQLDDKRIRTIGRGSRRSPNG